jgi:putative ABC transport system permease protein
VVARPVVAAGRWPQAGEAMLERSFARFLGIEPGEVLTVANGARVRVVGIGIVSQDEPYPQSQPGVAFAPTATLARVAPDRSRWNTLLGVRLADPGAAPAFAAGARRQLTRPVSVETWQSARDDAVASAKPTQVVLSTFAVLLVLAAGLVLATLIGGRVLAQVRELALLKAAGLTPGEVARVLLVEHVAFGALGVALGIAVGMLATPLFVSSSASLLDASETPSLDAVRVVLVAGVMLAAVALFTLLPSWRMGRRPTAGSWRRAPLRRRRGGRASAGSLRPSGSRSPSRSAPAARSAIRGVRR